MREDLNWGLVGRFRPKQMNGEGPTQSARLDLQTTMGSRGLAGGVCERGVLRADLRSECPFGWVFVSFFFCDTTPLPVQM
jgi:hypothetical protein